MIKLIRAVLLAILIFLSSCNPKKTDPKDNAANDSVNKYLELAGNDTIAFNKRIEYNDRAYSFIDLNKNDSMTRRALYLNARKDYLLNRNNKLMTKAILLHKLSLKSKDVYRNACSKSLLGVYFMNISENEKAISYLYKSLKYFRKRNASNTICSLIDISNLQYYSNDFLGSIKTSIEAIKLIKSKNVGKQDTHNLFCCFLILSDSFNELKQYKLSNYYCKKAEIYNKENALLFSRYALNFYKLNELDKATYFLNKIINNNKLKNIDPVFYYSSLSLKAEIELEKNSLTIAYSKLILAEKKLNYYNAIYGANHNQIRLSKYYAKINDSLNSILSAKKALEISKKYSNPNDILKSLEQLILVDKKNSYKYAQKYIRVNDSLNLAERRFRDKFAQIAYETDEITQEKEKAIQQKQIITVVSVFLVLIVLLLLVITQQRSKQKQLRLEHSQQKANEELYQLMLTQKTKEEEARQNEKRRIAQELHDGVMNKLASARLNLSAFGHKKEEQSIEAFLVHVSEIHQIEREIRNIAHDLSHEAFNTGYGFITLLTDFVFAQNHTTATSYKLEIESEIDWDVISSNIKMNLFRIIQEASNNINKFAQAKNAVISFVIDNENLCLSITDDGKGFSIETKKDGIGLKNIKLRVKALNGKFNIQSISNKSTSLNIAIPIS